MFDNAAPSRGFDVSTYLEELRAEPPTRHPVDFVRIGHRTGQWQAQAIPGTGASAIRAGNCWANLDDDSLTYRLPRGIPWTQYPITAPVRYRCTKVVCNEDMVEVFDEVRGNANRTSHWKPRMEALNQARGIVVDGGRSWNASRGPHQEAFVTKVNLAYAVAIADSLAPQVEFFAIDTGKRDIPRIGRREATDGVRGGLSLSRFSYSYQVNARAILARALAYGLSGLDDAELSRSRDSLLGPRERTETPKDGCAAECRQHVAEGRLHGIEGPISLQALYKIRRLGKVPHNGFGLSQEYRSVYVLQGLFGERRVGAMGWTGSGKHPARWYWLGELYYHLIGLTWFGLIQTDGEAVSLTDAGNRFLDALHPDSEDPDVLCRWIVPVVENRDIERSVDAWIMSVFSKCKTRVNALP